MHLDSTNRKSRPGLPEHRLPVDPLYSTQSIFTRVPWDMQFPWKCNLSFPHHLLEDWKIKLNTSVISFLELQELIKIYLVLISKDKS